MIVNQFEAEKCAHAASTTNLVLMIINNRSNPWAIRMAQIPEPGLKVDAKPWGLPGACWRLELTDALHYLIQRVI